MRRVDVVHLGVVVDKVVYLAHKGKSREVSDILRFCTDAIAGNIYIERSNSCQSCGSGSGSSSSSSSSSVIADDNCDRAMVLLNSSEALRSFLLQGLHGSAPESTRDLSLECVFCLFKTSNCKWSLESIQETKKMEGLQIGQFAGLLCSILRGEMHLALGEVVYLSGYVDGQKDNEGDDVSFRRQALTTEQKQARMDRLGNVYEYHKTVCIVMSVSMIWIVFFHFYFLLSDHLVPICCDLLDHVADFLMPPDGDGDGNGDEDEGIRCVYSTSINSGLWGNALPYQILLDIQQVDKILIT